MILNEFINKRMAELGLKQKVMTDAGIGAWTIKKIRENNTAQLTEGEFQKLALALQCSIGDLKACLAKQPDPLRKEAEKEEGYHEQPTVMEAVDKLEVMLAAETLRKGKRITAEPQPEPKRKELTAADVNWKVRQTEEAAKKVPVKQEAVTEAVMAETEAYDTAEPDALPDKEVMDELFPEDSEGGGFDPEVYRQEGEERFRQQLQQMFLQCASQVPRGSCTMTELMGTFGKAVLDTLVKDEEG